MAAITLHEILPDPARYPVAFGALALTAVFGLLAGPRGGNANPWFWQVVDGFFGRLGNRLDRPERKPGDLILRGFFFTLIVLFFSWAMGEAARRAAEILPFYHIPETLLLAVVTECPLCCRVLHMQAAAAAAVGACCREKVYAWLHLHPFSTMLANFAALPLQLHTQGHEKQG